MNCTAGWADQGKLYSRERVELDFLCLKSRWHNFAGLRTTDQNACHLYLFYPFNDPKIAHSAIAECR
jgi:hypothetical protein